MIKGVERIERPGEVSVADRAHFDQDPAPPHPGNDVDLAASNPYVPSQDFGAAPLEHRHREALTEVAHFRRGEGST
jgi:hypothetical protein